jgi:hypothetical protein
MMETMMEELLVTPRMIHKRSLRVMSLKSRHPSQSLSFRRFHRKRCHTGLLMQDIAKEPAVREESHGSSLTM